MDPYCIVKTRDHTMKTTTCKGCGKTPRWNETFEFRISDPSEEIMIKIMDDDLFKDDEVAICIFRVDSLISNGGVKDWFTVTHKDREAGKLFLEATFIPESMPK